MADIDEMDDGTERVLLMTLHSAKGLEFPNVYLTGLEEGIFPSFMSISQEDSEEGLEEERRLCYVGITRAMQRLTLTNARSRMLRGQTQYNAPSRFLEEIPEELLAEGDKRGGGFGKKTSAERGTFPRHADSEDGGALHAFGAQQSGGAAAEFRKAKAAFKEKAFDLSQFKVQRPAHLSYGEGDRVRHIKFGEGTVLKIADGVKDFEVTVDFDRAGVRKMFAGFARLERLT